MNDVRTIAQRARAAALRFAGATEADKNKALALMAEALCDQQDAILRVNAADLAAARESGLKGAFVERMTLNEQRIAQMADGLRDVSRLPDPVGEELTSFTRPNGLRIVKKRVPLGVVGVIYESRPNVTADAAGICLKSGNACILRGGKEAIRSNAAIYAALAEGAERALNIPGLIGFIDDPGREAVLSLMRLSEFVDALIPRGGEGLIKSVKENATVPVIETGTGNCHIFVHSAADINMAADIVFNAKTSRPSVCNAAETLLVDAAVAEAFLPGCAKRLQDAGVELRACERARALIAGAKAADEEDYTAEYNDLILCVKIVDSLDEAVSHINRYGTRHSEAIVTRDDDAARAFMEGVDAACVYQNASTRFTDGGEFGFGAEIGISNQKLHARGPMGLKELTTYKYLIYGDGQVRK